MIENLRSILDQQRNKYNFVTSADNALDGKVGVLLGFEIAIFLGYISLVLPHLHFSSLCLGASGIIVLVISILLLFWANWPKNYTTIAVNPAEHTDYLKMEETELLKQLIMDTQNAYQKNNDLLKIKVILYRLSIFLLFGSVILLSLSVLIYM